MYIKKKNISIILVAALIFNLSVFSGAGIIEAEAAVTTVTSGGVISNAAYSASFTIDKVDGLSSDFIMGVDVSSIIAMEAAGAKYYDYNSSTATDIFSILKAAGVNYIRVRVWNDPFLSTASSKTAANSYGGGVCSVDYAAQIGKRAAAAGMKLFVDFHYSDFWADPGKQTVPKAWSSYSTSQIASAISTFTTESLTTIKKAGADIGMVQIGNETTSKICGQSYNSSAGISYFKAGCNAVRSFNSSIKIVLHLTNPEKLDFSNYCSVFKSNSVDYDVLATSYYPIWHGGSGSSAMSTVINKLKTVKNTYGKDVLIAETGYPYTGSSNSTLYAYGVSVAAQAQFMRDLIAQVSSIGGLGVFYWEPAWLNTSSSDYTKYGTGWANSNAKEYDSEATGSFAPTTTNTAMFKKVSTGSGTYNFQALESLYVFKYVYKGTAASSSSSSSSSNTKTTTKSSTSTTKSSSATTKSSTATTKSSTTTTKSSTKSDGSTTTTVNHATVNPYMTTGSNEDTGESELTDENTEQAAEKSDESESTGEDSLDAESGENIDSASNEDDDEADGANIGFYGFYVLFGAVGLLAIAGAAAIIATVIKKKKNLADK